MCRCSTRPAIYPAPRNFVGMTVPHCVAGDRRRRRRPRARPDVLSGPNLAGMHVGYGKPVFVDLRTERSVEITTARGLHALAVPQAGCAGGVVTTRRPRG
jgi:hypothetical protein